MDCLRCPVGTCITDCIRRVDDDDDYVTYDDDDNVNDQLVISAVTGVPVRQPHSSPPRGYDQLNVKNFANPVPDFNPKLISLLQVFLRLSGGMSVMSRSRCN